MPVIIDFEAAGEGFGVLEEGSYPAKLTSVPKVERSRSNAANWNVNFEFDLLEVSGRKHWETRSLNQRALWRWKQELTDMGVEPPAQIELEELKEWLAETFPAGMEVILQMTQEDDWQGRKDKDGNTLQQNRATMRLPDGSESSGW